jgi:hypothetical protein
MPGARKKLPPSSCTSSGETRKPGLLPRLLGGATTQTGLATVVWLEDPGDQLFEEQVRTRIGHAGAASGCGSGPRAAVSSG